jgi:hypothetical protein
MRAVHVQCTSYDPGEFCDELVQSALGNYHLQVGYIALCFSFLKSSVFIFNLTFA